MQVQANQVYQVLFIYEESDDPGPDPDPDSADQIDSQGGIRYYNSTGQEVTTNPVLGGNAVVSVEKKIAGTSTENEFLISLDVKTSLDISEVKDTADAAVVLVLDISGSMVDHRNTLITAANKFLDDFTKDANGAARYVALVTFETTARIDMTWTDVTVPENLTAMKNEISWLLPAGWTNMDGGLKLARNLLRTDALPNGRDGKPIENRNVILFSDGEANYTGYDAAGYTTGTSIGSYSTTAATAENAASSSADVIKNSSSYSVNSVRFNKHDAVLYTIAFGAGAPVTFLQTRVATNSSCAYTAANSDKLGEVFAAIVKRIESWAEAWIVTDPMGANIEFMTVIPPNDISTGLLKFDYNILTWDLKKASPNSFNNNIFTYTYTYRIRLNTTSAAYQPGVSYPTNGITRLSYVMLIDNVISSDLLTATFNVPSVHGYAAAAFNFRKIGGSSDRLAGCQFLLQNRTRPEHSKTATSAAGTGLVNFSSIPSGYTYSLSETYMPDSLKSRYNMSDEVYTVTVSKGVLTIRNGQGDVVSDGFQFINPMKAKTVTGLVTPFVSDDIGLGLEFLEGFTITVELRTAFYTPAPADLKTSAVFYDGATGKFTLENVPFGTYILYISRPGYIDRCMNVTVSESDPAVIELSPPGAETAFNLWPGDANHDFVVDNRDILFLMDYININALSAQYTSYCDFNADGVIDVRDILMLYDYINKNILDYPGADGVDMSG